MTLSIDVVIPTHGRWDLTEGCLACLRRQTVPHNVIVADNASADGTRRWIRALYPEVRLVEMPSNLGFPAACNSGAASGHGEILVLLNNDVQARPDFLERLTHPFLTHAALGMTAALLVRPNERMIDSVGLTADPTLASFPRLRGHDVSLAGSDVPRIAGPCGAGGAYRRSAWERVGGLDEGVLFYGEDLDLALRIRSAGWDVVAVPDAVATHIGSATFAVRSPWQRYQSGFARAYFLRRYGLLRTRVAPRVLATEAVVVAGDAVLSHDLSALRGRIAGWRAGRGVPRRPHPPKSATDSTIGFWNSLALRRAVYAT